MPAAASRGRCCCCLCLYRLVRQHARRCVVVVDIGTAAAGIVAALRCLPSGVAASLAAFAGSGFVEQGVWRTDLLRYLVLLHVPVRNGRPLHCNNFLQLLHQLRLCQSHVAGL